MKKHSVFIGFFGFAVIIFLWKLISMRGGFVYGDYSDQFYPWSMIYAEQIKNFQFPFWTRYVQSGFPLMAEGQVGGFYPLNVIFYFLFPFRVAYNYLTVVHFVMAGIFTYIYAGKVGACKWGSALAAFLFCFGSAYAGCMINTATLKALAWMPLILFLFENYFNKRRAWLLGLSGVLLGFQFLSGAPQVAFYSGIICVVYFMAGLIVRRELRLIDLVWLAAGFFIAAIMFLPQFLLSRTVAELSWRSGAGVDFALSGSFSPLALMSVVFPYPVPGGARLYVGLLSVLFFIAAMLGLRKRPVLYPLLAILVFSMFIALGKYNPVFVFLIRTFEFYNFRGPSKAILFSIFSVAVISGVGFSVFFSDGNLRKKALGVFSVFLPVMLAAFFAFRGILIVFKDRILSFGEYLVRRDVYGKPFHRYDIETYMGKVEGFYESMLDSSSLSRLPVLFSVVLCVLLIVLGWYLFKSNKVRHFYRTVFLMIVFIDLAVFGSYGTGFRGNIRDFDFIEPECKKLFHRVKEDKDLFRIFPYDLVSAKLPNWTDPSLNSVYGIDSISFYTPLANEYYRKELEDLEVVDNALGLKKPREDALEKNLALVRSLNVKYIISPDKLEKPFLEKISSEKGIFLYKLKGWLPRAFVSKDLSFSGIDLDIQVHVSEYSSGYAALEVNMPYKGFLVFSENRYPGWKAEENGHSSEIEAFSVIQAVRLDKGNHIVKFSYHPFSSYANRIQE